MHLYSRNVVAAHSLIFMCSISVTPLQCASFVSPSHLYQSYQSIWTCGGFHPPPRFLYVGCKPFGQWSFTSLLSIHAPLPAGCMLHASSLLTMCVWRQKLRRGSSVRLVAVCGAETTPVLCCRLATSAPVSTRFFRIVIIIIWALRHALSVSLLRAADTLSLGLNNMLF